MSDPCFFRPVIVPTDAALPIPEALNRIAAAVNWLSAQGWEVILPATMIPTGSKLVGGNRNLLWVFWVRCPADSPLCRQDPAPPSGMHDPSKMDEAEVHGMNREAVRV